MRRLSPAMLWPALAVTLQVVLGAAATGPDSMVEFMADFLAEQTSFNAPAHISGIVCKWDRATVAQALSSRGLAARLLPTPLPPPPAPPAPPTSPASTMNAASNALFVKGTTNPEQALRTLGRRVLARWALGLAARGRPGVPVEPAQGEEIVLDTTCPGADQLLNLASDMNLFRRPFRWLLLRPNCSDGALPALEDSTPRAALVDSQVTVACAEAAEAAEADALAVRAFEVFRPGLGRPADVRPVASWTPRGPLRMLSARRGDAQRHLHGLTVHTGIALLDSKDSIHHLTDGRQRSLDQLTKTTFMNLVQAYELINATMELHVTNSHGYLRNGTYDGLLGDLNNGLVEVGGTCMLFAVFRMMAITFLGFNMPMRAVMVFRQPALAYTDNVFWLPFPDTLWAAALSLVVLCCFLVVLALYLEPVSETRGEQVGEAVTEQPVTQAPLGAGRGGPKQAMRFSVSDVFLLAFGAIAQQGSPVEARGLVARLITFLLFVAVLLFFTCYSASIVVLLQSSSTSIRTLRDVWLSRLELGAENTPYNNYFLEQMGLHGDEVRRGLWRKLAPPGRPRNFMSLDEGVSRMQRGLFAFVAIHSTMYGAIQTRFEEHEKCDLYEVNGYSPLRDPHLVSRRGSPVTHMLKIKLLLQWERGLRERSILRSMYSKPQCDVKGARFMSVSIVGASSAFYLVVGGLALSILVLLAELLHARLSCLKRLASTPDWSSDQDE